MIVLQDNINFLTAQLKNKDKIISSLLQQLSKHDDIEHVYMRPEVTSNWFEISNRFEKSCFLNGDFTAAVCK